MPEQVKKRQISAGLLAHVDASRGGLRIFL